VTVTFDRLAERLGEGLVAVPLQGRPAQRAVYALAPPEGQHPLVPVFLDVLGDLLAAADQSAEPRRNTRSGS
jgi:DNA-binding transcriptional LysR family regulator